MTNTTTRSILIAGNGLNIEGLRQTLTGANFHVVSFERGGDAIEYIGENGLPYLMLVNLELPDMDGIELCEEFYDTTGLPIIAVSDNLTSERATSALHYADDFVGTHVSVEELAMRVRRILSRINDFSYASGPKIPIYDWLVLDPVQREVNVQGKVYKLTPIENALLNMLIKHKGDVVDADTLIERIWHSDPTLSDRNVLRVHIHRLRQKLEADPTLPRVIMTERGIGYSFADLQQHV
jgi:DNA-binding response OmpR family regulator